MSKYYNATRGPIAVSLSSGKAVSVPPKSWIDIDPADEGSPNLAPLVRKKYLIRSALDSAAAAQAVEAVPVPVVVPVAAPAPAVHAPAAASVSGESSLGKKK